MTSNGFLPEQRRELQDTLGLLPAQVDELESDALRKMRAILRRQPTKSNVRAELEDEANALRSAEDAISRLLRGSLAHPAGSTEVGPKDAAAARVMLATFEAEEDPEVLDRALVSIGAALRVIEKAIAGLPDKPTRHRTASPQLVSLIDKALLSGFLKAHGHWPGTSGQGSDKPLPAYPIKTSCADGSDYRRIVEVCFEAAGAEADQGRERAIREFMRQKRARRMRAMDA